MAQQRRNEREEAPSADSVEYIRSILKKDLPRSDINETTHWSFLLGKSTRFKPAKPIRKNKKHFLTRKQRKQLGLLKLPRAGWNYRELEPLRQLWQEYMRKSLDNLKKAPSCEDPAWNNLGTSLAKMEYVGAEITVTRSTVPSTVGMSGTVVLETKASFQIVTPKSELKMLLKRSAVFTFQLDGMKFTLFGRHVAVKPNERSVKKIKTQLIPDL